MKRIKLLILATGLLIFASCSEHVWVNFQTESANTGKVILKPNKATRNTYVTVNDKLIVDKEYVKSVTISNIPSGDYNIHYTSDNSLYKDNIDAEIPIEMENGKEVTKLVAVPPYSTGYWVFNITLAGMVLALLLLQY